MLKWKIAAVIGLAFGVAGMVWGYAEQKKAVGFYELRIYTAQPGKRDALAARFASRTAAIFATLRVKGPRASEIVVGMHSYPLLPV